MFRLGFVLTDAPFVSSEPTAPEARTCRYRKLTLRELYRDPDDSWRDVLHRARARFGLQGEYKRPDQSLEVWTEHATGMTIQAGAELAEWPCLARRLQEATQQRIR